VLSVCFSPDGQRLASATATVNDTGEARVWDLRSGKVLFAVKGHTCVCFSPDGRHLATGGGGKSRQSGEVTVWDAQSGQKLFSVEGHTIDGIKTVCYSPDGRYLATAPRDEGVQGKVELWDAHTGQGRSAPDERDDPFARRKIPKAQAGQELSAPDADMVNSMTFSPDGKSMAVGHLEGAGIWDLRSGKELHALKGFSDVVESVCFSPDGQRLATASGSLVGVLPGEVKVWDVPTGKELLTLKGHTRPVASMSFSPDGQRLVTASHDNTTKVWDVRTRDAQVSHVGQKLDDNAAKLWNVRTSQEALPLRGAGEGMSFSPDGKRIATGNAVWDARTGEKLLTLKADSRTGTVCFSPDGQRFATAGDNPDGGGRTTGIVRIWDARTGQLVLTLSKPKTHVFSMCFSPDGQLLAVGSSVEGKSGEVTVWDTGTGKEFLALKSLRGGVTSISFSPDGQRLGTTSPGTGGAKVWDARTGKELLVLKGGSFDMSCICFSPDGQRLATGGHNFADLTALGQAVVWEATTGKPLYSLKGHTYFVTSICFSPDGERLATTSGGELKIWDARTGLELFSRKGAGSVCFSPDGMRIATTGADQTVFVWDGRPGEEVLSLNGHSGSVYQAYFSPDGQRLATASEDGTARVWDMRTGEELHTLKGHTLPVSSVCFSPDGQRLATTSGTAMDFPSKESKPGDVKLWDANTGEELHTLRDHSAGASCACFSPDGRRLASGSGNLELKEGKFVARGAGAKIWDARAGEQLLDLKEIAGPVFRACFSADGQRLATASVGFGGEKQRPYAEVQVWNASTGEKMLALQGQTHWVTSMSFSPDGQRLATGGGFSGDDISVKLWDASSGRELRSFEGNTAPVISVCFSADGKCLVASDQSGKTVAWDIHSGRHLDEPPPKLAGFDSVRTPDGRLFARIDGTVVRLIRAPDAEELFIRRHRTGLDPKWHAAEAARCEQAG
jgi:WD40 repeat protein